MFVQVVVPGPGEPGAGDVYVKFDSSESALGCKAVLHGRMFDGKAVRFHHLEIVPIGTECIRWFAG